MKDGYEQLLIQKRAEMAAQTPQATKDWRRMLPEISEHMQGMLTYNEVPYAMVGSGIRLLDNAHGEEIIWSLLEALECTVGWVGAYEAKKVLDTLLE